MAVKSGKTLFVISPIGETNSDERRHADMLYHAIIEPVADELKYSVDRADRSERPGMITDHIINSIVDSDICIVDMSFLNPNVFYELGLRHYVQKPAIHLARTGTKIPFDNAGYRACNFDLGEWSSHEKLRKFIRGAISEIEDGSYKLSNPVTQANAIREVENSGDPKDDLIISLEKRLSNLESNYFSLDVSGSDPVVLSSVVFSISRFNENSLNKIKLISDKQRHTGEKFDDFIKKIDSFNAGLGENLRSAFDSNDYIRVNIGIDVVVFQSVICL